MIDQPTNEFPARLGAYDVLEQIGQGGIGSVFKGRHRASGDVVAIKVIAAHLAQDSVLLKRFEQEFLLASRLQHPNVVRFLSFGQEGSTHYLVMEFVEGESLGQRIERLGRLAEAEALGIIAQVADALSSAHEQGIVHRDVKPDNVLLTSGGQAKLADFGIVKEVDAGLDLTEDGRALGTPHFMAPEQFRNAKKVDRRSDIYALAATLYLAITGERPFCARGPLLIWSKKANNELVPPRQLVPTLSEQVDRAVRRALHADPEQRPASCRHFIDDLLGRKPAESAPIQPDTCQPDSLPLTVAAPAPRGERRVFPRRRAKGSARFQPPGGSFQPLSPQQWCAGAKVILVNLSQGGVGVLVQDPVRIGDLLDIELLAPSGGERLVRRARVCWSQPGPGGYYYHIGCSWDQPLTCEQLQRFIS